MSTADQQHRSRDEYVIRHAILQASEGNAREATEAFEAMLKERDERDGYVAAGTAEYDGAQAARRGVSIEDCPYGPNKPDEFRDSTLMGMWQKGHDLVTRAKRIEELESHLAWIRAKLKLPEGTGMFVQSGIAGTLHVWDARQHGYTAYIEAFKCNEKDGEIGRLTKLNHDLAAIIGCLEPGENGKPSCDPPCIVCQALGAVVPEQVPKREQNCRTPV